MTVDIGALIVGIVMLAFGVGATYAAIGLIGNLRGLGDRALAHYAGHPGRGGWRRASAADPSYRSSEGTTLLALHYVPKTLRQVKLVGWATLLPALFTTALGLLFSVAAFTGAVT